MFNMVVYEKNNGKTTALDFMEELPAKYRSKILKKLELLKEQGNNLGEPHVKPIEGKLWELRIQYKSDQVRMIYFIDENQTIVLLHGFVKKDQKIRRSEIETAQKRLKEYKNK